MEELNTLVAHQRGKKIKEHLEENKISNAEPHIDDTKFVYAESDKQVTYGAINDAYIYITLKKVAVIMEKKTGFVNISYICRSQNQDKNFIDSWKKTKKQYLQNISQLTKMPEDKLMVQMGNDVYALSCIAVEMARSISDEYAETIKSILLAIALS